MHRKACVKSEITSRSSNIAIKNEIIQVFPMISNMLSLVVCRKIVFEWI